MSEEETRLPPRLLLLGFGLVSMRLLVPLAPPFSEEVMFLAAKRDEDFDMLGQSNCSAFLNQLPVEYSCRLI